MYNRQEIPKPEVSKHNKKNDIKKLAWINTQTNAGAREEDPDYFGDTLTSSLLLYT